MPFDVLTRDIRPNIEAPDGPQPADAGALEHPTRMPVSAGACTEALRAEVEAYVQAGIASATKRAYRADLDHFKAWGGTVPATDAQLAAYLADHAAVLKVSTLTRRLAAVSIAHEARDLANPVRTPLVRATMRGIRREHGAAQHQAKPLLREDLFVVLGAMGDRLKDLRDRALLLIGFAGGLRRSELAAINLIDFERVREGIILTIRRSKTDQDGVGRKIGIPFGRTIHCPVRALENWLSAARIEDGPVFRPVDRHGRVSGRLSGEAVSLIIRGRMSAAGFDPTGYSGHSLRAGFATSATRAGVSTFKIRQQTGHASDAMLSRYVREGSFSSGTPQVFFSRRWNGMLGVSLPPFGRRFVCRKWRSYGVRAADQQADGNFA